MQRQDMNCFIGNWPFFRIRCNSVEKLQKLHSDAGITGGLISSLEAVFYQDPYEAELQLAEQIKGTAYRHAMILNPALPAWQDDLRRCAKELKISAVRLMPGYHGYTLTDPVMDQVAAVLMELNLPLVITMRVRDERTAWIVQPNNIPMTDVTYFVNKHRGLPVLLAGIRVAEIGQLTPDRVSWENLYVEISCFKDGFQPLEDAWAKEYVRGHIFFGSSAPMFEIQVPLLQMETADIPQQDKEKIFAGWDAVL